VIVRIRVATRADEPALRALSAAVAMPGGIAIAFEREPDYFLACSTLGEPFDVLVGEDDGGAIVAVGCRATRSVALGGRTTSVWTIGHLRIAPGARGRWLAAGARWFREREEPGRIGFALIARGNPRARGALVGARPPGGLRVERVDGVTTHALLVHRIRVRAPAGVEVRAASAADEAAVLDFWRREGPRRNFFPFTAAGEMGGATLRGLAWSDVWLAERAGEPIGTIAVWDRSAYVQEVVVGYGAALRCARIPWNAFASIGGGPRLPRLGEAIPLACAARFCVQGDDPRVAASLLRAALAQAWRSGIGFLMVASTDRDPLRRVVARFLHVPYRSDLHALAWGAEIPREVHDRVAYVEIAAT
jgi:hypothetical protein